MGIALLHELLSVVYAAAKDAKADALMITQTPHPSFADVADMVRLNDMLRLDDPGPLPADAGVPHYSTQLDRTGEQPEVGDYGALRRSWAEWREGLWQTA